MSIGPAARPTWPQHACSQIVNAWKAGPALAQLSDPRRSDHGRGSDAAGSLVAPAYERIPESRGALSTVLPWRCCPSVLPGARGARGARAATGHLASPDTGDTG